MVNLEKFMWVKFGWSDYYRGGLVDGNFRWLKEWKKGGPEHIGNEAFNFMPDADGTYYCHVPPQAKTGAPSLDTGHDWTVVCLAKNPKHKGIHIVGWYENATLHGWQQPNPVAAAAGKDDWLYSITSQSVYFVPPEQRTDPFSDASIKQGKYSYLTGPGVRATDNKERVFNLLLSRLSDLSNVAIHNPTPDTVPDPENSPDPLGGLGTAEHRKKVELAAEKAVVAYYKADGFSRKRVAQFNLGYDYIFTKGEAVHYVEVKGTSGPDSRFFLTRNEEKIRSKPGWRLGMVTDALKDPKVTIYDNRAFKKAFDLEPLVYTGRPIFEPKDE